MSTPQQSLVDRIAAAGIDPENVDPTAIDLSPRDRHRWEVALECPLEEFTMNAQMTMLAWWEAGQQGREMTPDQVLDLPGSTADSLAVDALIRLGKADGAPAPSASPTGSDSTISPSSDTTTTSP